MPRKKHRQVDESSPNFAGVPPPSELRVLKRQATQYLRKLHPEVEYHLCVEAIAEGIASLVEKFPNERWKTLPRKRVMNTIIGSATNWLRRNLPLIRLGAVIPPSFPDTDSAEEESFPDSTLNPDELVAYRYDLVWLLQHLSAEELVIVFARWLDFEYSEIVTLLTRKEATAEDISNLRQTCHRLRLRMMTLLKQAGYDIVDIHHRRIGKKRSPS